MLQLLATDVDICGLSKVLGRLRLKSSITDSTIIIDADEIPESVVDELFANATILEVQNYSMDSDKADSTETTSKQDVEKLDIQSATEESTLVTAKQEQIVEDSENEFSMQSDESTDFTDFEEAPANSEYDEESNYEDIGSKDILEEVKELPQNSQVELDPLDASDKKRFSQRILHRGDVFKWALVKNDEDPSRQPIKECIIIIQNDYERSKSDETVALFCTSDNGERASHSSINYWFRFTGKNMVDYNPQRLDLFARSNFFIGRIQGVKRDQVGKYLGTMTYDFMNTLQPTIDFCLGLKRSRTLNWAQLEMLSFVDMKVLLGIAESNMSRKEKVEEILKLFGFDLSSNGVEYLEKAILHAYDLGYYTLEFLAETIAKKQNVDAAEVLRLIVARTKENFHFRNSPAISFIRLVDRLLKKG